MIVVVMGVSGAGKTTVGRRLASDLGWVFVEGDDFHPAANVEKMRGGHPLTDADRLPWLHALRARIDDLAASGRSAVVACSALRQAYRDVLAAGRPDLVFVWLTAPPALLRGRLARRTGHYMPAGLLDSQLATLEPPVGMPVVDASAPAGEVAATIRDALGLGRDARGARTP